MKPINSMGIMKLPWSRSSRSPKKECCTSQSPQTTIGILRNAHGVLQSDRLNRRNIVRKVCFSLTLDDSDIDVGIKEGLITTAGVEKHSHLKSRASASIDSSNEKPRRLCDLPHDEITSGYGKWGSGGTVDTSESSLGDESSYSGRSLNDLLDAKIAAKKERLRTKNAVHS